MGRFGPTIPATGLTSPEDAPWVSPQSVRWGVSRLV
jgi:hypothetical protein